MIGAAVDRGTPQQAKWLQQVRVFVQGEGNQNLSQDAPLRRGKDDIAQQMFRYSEKFAEAANSMAKATKEAPEGEKPSGMTQEPDSDKVEAKEEYDPNEPWIGPVIFSIFVLSPEDLKALFKLFKKIK
jgi:hypothetical protein